jgi:hypothetical protein
VLIESSWHVFRPTKRAFHRGLHWLFKHGIGTIYPLDFTKSHFLVCFVLVAICSSANAWQLMAPYITIGVNSQKADSGKGDGMLNLGGTYEVTKGASLQRLTVTLDWPDGSKIVTQDAKIKGGGLPPAGDYSSVFTNLINGTYTVTVRMYEVGNNNPVTFATTITLEKSSF